MNTRHVIARMRTREIKLRAIEFQQKTRRSIKADRSDPLREAKRRGVNILISMLRDELVPYLSVSAEEAEIFIDCYPYPLPKERLEERIGLDFGTGEFLYPVWQFDHPSGTLHGLEDIVQALRDEGIDPFTQVQFFHTPIIWLSGKTPLEFIAWVSGDGDPQVIIEIIRNTHLEQGWNN
jgi:hypothetical protein